MIKLYMHGGSANHGCEAIIRGTKQILGEKLFLYSQDINADYKYNLNRIITIMEEKVNKIKPGTLRYYKAAIFHRLYNNDYMYYKILKEDFFNEVHKGDIYLSVGGDNYCYAGKDVLGYYNKIIHKKGGKTILWGCSVEPSDIKNNAELRKDLELYDKIVARETISYNALKSINKNTVLYPDPAFQLDKIELELPERFIDGNTVGINVSPLIINCEKDKGITYENYKELMKYILKNTEMNIALIPHVVWENNDDRVPLKQLYEEFKNSNRVVLISDCNCMELKGYISRCRFFIGARTHATIAAYSTGVPTLVVGYSVKAKGIAKDIFGTYENYILPVQKLKAKDDLKKHFIWIKDKEDNIKDILTNFIKKNCSEQLIGRMRGEIKDI